MALVLQIVLIPGTNTVIIKIMYEMPESPKSQRFLNDLMSGKDVKRDFLRVLIHNIVPTRKKMNKIIYHELLVFFHYKRKKSYRVASIRQLHKQLSERQKISHSLDQGSDWCRDYPSFQIRGKNQQVQCFL